MLNDDKDNFNQSIISEYRTTHLLPPANKNTELSPEEINKKFYEQKPPYYNSSYGRGYTFGNEYYISYWEPTPILYRYAASLISKNNKRYIAKIISHLELLDWCQLHNYQLICGGKIGDNIYSDTKERTEITNIVNINILLSSELESDDLVKYESNSYPCGIDIDT